MVFSIQLSPTGPNVQCECENQFVALPAWIAHCRNLEAYYREVVLRAVSKRGREAVTSNA